MICIELFTNRICDRLSLVLIGCVWKLKLKVRERVVIVLCIQMESTRSEDPEIDDDFSEIYKEYTGPVTTTTTNVQEKPKLPEDKCGEEEEQQELPDPNSVPTDFTSREAKVWEAKSKATERNWKKRKEEEMICKICGESGHFTQVNYPLELLVSLYFVTDCCFLFRDVHRRLVPTESLRSSLRGCRLGTRTLELCLLIKLWKRLRARPDARSRLMTSSLSSVGRTG